MKTNHNGKSHHGSSLTPERIELIKQRIAEKYYERDEVLFEVAKRILESHDLDDFSMRHSPHLN